MKSLVAVLVCFYLTGCSGSTYVKKSKILEVGGLAAAAKMVPKDAPLDDVLNQLGEPEVITGEREKIISIQDSRAGASEWEYRMWVSRDPQILGSLSVRFRDGRVTSSSLNVPGEKK